MQQIEFYKFSGCGNDFIIIDNRDNIVEGYDLPGFVSKVCRRKMSVGADGLILIENSDKADFKWHFFNSDGSRAEMCGNGARCAARFAYLKKIAGTEMTFETQAGIISAKISGNGVKIKMTDTDSGKDFVLNLADRQVKASFINTGVPHAVIITENIDDVEVVKQGREIRHHEQFKPAGTNVNFVCRYSTGIIANRTYERGVEDETLACGTGVVAAALIMAKKYGIPSPAKVLTKSGAYLNVHFRKSEDRFVDVFLEGDARMIYRGELLEDSWN